MLFGLVVFSLPAFRHRLYKSFYWSHVALAVTYIGLCFWHFGNLGDSWAYLWATVAIWLFSMLGRIFVKNQSFKITKAWPAEFPTCLRSLPGGMTRVDVWVPSSLSWTPGQHCYVRLPLLSPFDNHPFTIASASDTPKLQLARTSDELKPMVFFVRTHGGFTKKLRTYAEINTDVCTSAWLDGPYGGVSHVNAKRYDTMILIAGGSGITACLSWLLDCAQKMKDGIGTLSNIKLLWMVQSENHAEWVSNELKAAKALIDDSRIEIDIYVTRAGTDERGLGDHGSAKEKQEASHSVDSTSSKSSASIAASTFHSGRPYIPHVLPRMLSANRNIIIGTSPHIFHYLNLTDNTRLRA